MTALVALPGAPAPEAVSPGFAGFAVTFVLAVATVLLIRSMVKHLRKVRYTPGAQDGPPAGPAAGDSPNAAPDPVPDPVPGPVPDPTPKAPEAPKGG